MNKKNESGRNTTTYPVDGSNTTLIEFLRKVIKGKSRNNIKSILKYGAVSVDGEVKTAHNFPLKVGQTVTVKLDYAKPLPNKPALRVLFEDEFLIAVEKPPGLLTVATDTEKTNTAYRILSEQINTRRRHLRIYVVHRLDKDTSGVLLFAKEEKIKDFLQTHWNETVLKREYTAIVEGVPENKTGTIHSHLKETTKHIVYSGNKADGGLEAITNYRLVKQGNGYAKVELFILTGRKNQIRVHMKESGHCVAGDKKYGARSNPIGRLCLHAHTLEFIHPITQEVIRIQSPEPSSFDTIVKKTT